MYSFIENHKKLINIILALIALSFVTFGVGNFVNLGNQYITKIRKKEITIQEVQNVIANSNKINTQENVEQIYNNLMNYAYITQGLQNIGVFISNKKVKNYLISSPRFKDENGTFNKELLNNFLQNYKNNEKYLFNSIKNDLYLEDSNEIFNDANIISTIQIDNFIKSNLAIREVQNIYIKNDNFIDIIKPTNNNLEDFYRNNTNKFKIKKAIKFEYINLSPIAIKDRQQITEDEIQTFFKKLKHTPQRQISHILIAFPQGQQNNENIKNMLKNKATTIANSLKSTPSKFALAVKEFSEDPNTANNEGDLGFVSKSGNFGEEFDKVAFSLKDNDIAVVESVFGYHIIKVGPLLSGNDYNREKNYIKNILQLAKAKKDLATIKNELSELTFNYPDNLEYSAKKLGLTLSKYDEWITLDDSKEQNIIPMELVEKLFSEDSIQNKLNTELVSNDKGSWVARVIDVRKESIPNFEDIKNIVEQEYKIEESKKIAQKEAKKLFEALKNGTNNNEQIKWSETVNLTIPAMKELFEEKDINNILELTPKEGSPKYYLLSDNNNGQVILKINKIIYNHENNDDINLIALQNLKDVIYFKELISFINVQKKQLKIKKGHQKLESLLER